MIRISHTGLRALLLSTSLAGVACGETDPADGGPTETGDAGVEAGADAATDAEVADGEAADSGLPQEAGSDLDASTATTSVRTLWRLWGSMGTTFSEHSLQGPDGELGNTVQCTVSDTQVDLLLVDEGLDELEQVVRPRSAVQIQLDRADDTVCTASVTEAPYGDTSGIAPEFQDSCDSGCTFDLTVTEDAASLEVEGTLECTQMKDGPLSAPLELASSLDLNTLEPRPMAFHITRCEAK